MEKENVRASTTLVGEGGCPEAGYYRVVAQQLEGGGGEGWKDGEELVGGPWEEGTDGESSAESVIAWLGGHTQHLWKLRIDCGS